MNLLNRPARVLAAAVTTLLLLTACTPEQAATYRELTGHDLPAGLDSVDGPIQMGDGTVIHPDGHTTAPSSCASEKARVNALTYSMDDPAPAMDAFRSIARACRGWTEAEVASWEIAIKDIMHFESHYCPNVLGGAKIGTAHGCVLARQGRRGDAGFGQLISIHYRHTSAGTGWLCAQEGLCSKWDVIASPSNSMTALLALVERSGVQGWCYSRSARRLHAVTCSHPGLDV